MTKNLILHPPFFKNLRQALLLLPVFYFMCLSRAQGQLPEGFYDVSIVEYNEHPDIFHIRTYIHFLESDPPSGWITAADATTQSNAMLNLLNEEYNKHDIFFVNGADNSCQFSSASFVPLTGTTNQMDFTFYQNFISNFTGPKGLHIFVASNTVGLNGGVGVLGWAFSVPCNIALVSGNEDGVPIALSPVLIHQVGHCLGLLHPHHFFKGGKACPEELICPFPPPNEDRCCNDLVEDTPTLDNLICTDPNPIPLAKNYMASANKWLCRDHFTPIQVLRMREYLKSYNATSLLQDMQVLPISSNLPSISGNIVVETGELVILANQTLEMLPGASITVKKGARLIVNGTITGACGQMWQGIIVEGIDVDVTQSPTQQGYLRMNPGSKLEYAHVGIKVGRLGSDGGGGIVEIYGALLKDNTVGIDFAEYTRVGISGGALIILPNKSYISFSNFTITNDYRGAVSPKPLHVKLGAIKDLLIRFSNFKEERPTCANRATGISAFDGGVKITSSQFIGLETGILTDKLTLPNGSLGVSDSKFEGCLTGIVSSMMGAGFSVRNNRFILSSDNSCDADFPFLLGVRATGLTLGINCTGNIFENAQPEKLLPENRTTGIHSISIGDFNNEINKNTYRDLHIGNRATGINGAGVTNGTGLAYFCNTHERNAQQLTPTANYLFDGSVRNAQGRLLESGGFDPAGNLFGVATNRINSALPVNYYYYKFDMAQDPTVGLQSTGITPIEVEIANRECAPKEPCPTPPCDISDAKTQFFINKTVHDYKKTQLTTTSNPDTLAAMKREIAFRRQKMDANATLILQHYAQDSTQTIIDSVLRWLYLTETPDAWTVMAKHYYFERDFASFDAIWDAIPAYFNIDALTDNRYQRLDIFFDLMRAIPVRSDWQGRLEENTVQQLRALLTDCDEAAYLSAAMLRRNGMPAPNIPCRPLVTSQMEPQQQKALDRFIKATLTIAPNPASTAATLVSDIPFEGAQVLLLDGLGRMRVASTGAVAGNMLRLDTEALPSGIYTVVVRHKQGILTGKLAVQH